LCVAIDRNGYLPVHRPHHSQPQRPDDVEWNDVNSRNRRIYNDPKRLAAARNTRPYLIQQNSRVYDGKKQVLRPIAALVDGMLALFVDPMFFWRRHNGQQLLTAVSNVLNCGLLEPRACFTLSPPAMHSQIFTDEIAGVADAASQQPRSRDHHRRCRISHPVSRGARFLQR
jgi:hypothetical protein